MAARYCPAALISKATARQTSWAAAMILQSAARDAQVFSAAAFAFSGAVKLPAKAAILRDGEKAIAFHRSLTTSGAGPPGLLQSAPPEHTQRDLRASGPRSAEVHCRQVDADSSAYYLRQSFEALPFALFSGTRPQIRVLQPGPA